jgi:hypothetical protein
MARRDIQDVGMDLATMFAHLPAYVDTDQHILGVIAKLMNSVYRSAEDPKRGDFAKGREQMAMHAIALLVGAKNWKEIESVLFEDNNGD